MYTANWTSSWCSQVSVLGHFHSTIRNQIPPSIDPSCYLNEMSERHVTKFRKQFASFLACERRHVACEPQVCEPNLRVCVGCFCKAYLMTLSSHTLSLFYRLQFKARCANAYFFT